MGTKGTEIVGGDAKKIVELLNKAFADEWLAYYQYWIGAQVVRGPMKGAVIAELIEHANETSYGMPRRFQIESFSLAELRFLSQRNGTCTQIVGTQCQVMCMSKRFLNRMLLGNSVRLMLTTTCLRSPKIKTLLPTTWVLRS